MHFQAWLNTRVAGFASAVLGVLAVSPDAALLRLESEVGGTTPVIGVWRYVLLFLCNLVLASALQGGVRQLIAGVRRDLPRVLGASVIIVGINAGFTISLLHVSPALALVLISLNPLWAALLGKVLLGDPLPRRTVIAQGLSLVATTIVFVPTLMAMLETPLDDAGTDAGPGATDTGDLFDAMDFVPLATGFLVAALLIYSRWHANASLEAAPALGALLSGLGAAAYMLLVEARPPSELVEGLPPPFWIAMVLSALGSGAYDSALVIAPRSLSGVEVSRMAHSMCPCCMLPTAMCHVACSCAYGVRHAHGHGREQHEDGRMQLHVMRPSA